MNAYWIGVGAVHSILLSITNPISQLQASSTKQLCAYLISGSTHDAKGNRDCQMQIQAVCAYATAVNTHYLFAHTAFCRGGRSKGTKRSADLQAVARQVLPSMMPRYCTPPHPLAVIF